MEFNTYRFSGVLPILIAVAMLEGLVLTYLVKRAYDWRENFASIGVALGQRLANILTFGFVTGVYWWVWEHRAFTVALDDVASFALLVLGVEFCYYWHHRLSHEIRWFWATHAVHHSAENLTFGVAYRLGWTGGVTGAAFFYLPLVWLGFHPVAIFSTLAINLIYQFWLHNEWMPKLGPLEWVLNTPSHHRVHHAVNPRYLDRNYGGMLVIFDRLFGTLVVEDEKEACRYGLVTPVNSFNPIRIAFHEWIAIGRDLRGARTWRERVGFLFGPPGWCTDGSRKTSAMLRAEARREQTKRERAQGVDATHFSVSSERTLIQRAEKTHV
jgi:sterol desaturase/sphingolipid hydroxylase (fatty acid hydroxylase superfamily)